MSDKDAWMKPIGYALLALVFVAGCNKPNPVAVPVVPRPPGDFAGEDPELLEYAKKKNWSLLKDRRTWNNKPVISLWIRDPAIAPEDCKVIAKAKTVQMLNFGDVKNLTDDGLKSLVGISSLDTLIIGGAQLTDAGLQALTQCKNLEALILRESPKVTDAGLKAVAQCKTIDTISIRGCKVSDAGVKELAALPRLRFLELQYLRLEATAFASFAGSKTLETLKLDELEGLTDDGVKTIAQLPALKDLEISNEIEFAKKHERPRFTGASIKAIVAANLPPKFRFDAALIDDDLLALLVAKGWFYGPAPRNDAKDWPKTAAELKVIGLIRTQVTDKGFRAALGHCTHVEKVLFSEKTLGDEALKVVAGFKNLKHLGLIETSVTGVGLEAVSGLPIQVVDLQYSKLSEDMFRALGKMKQLEVLRLSGSNVTGDWFKHLAQSSIQELVMSKTEFDDVAARHVAGTPNLQRLDASGTKLTDAGLQELLKLPKLESINVSRTKATDAALIKAARDRPKLSIER